MSELYRPNVGILASGSGTTLRFFLHAIAAGNVSANVAMLISNNSKGGAFQVAERTNQQYGLEIATRHISNATHPGETDGKLLTKEASAAMVRAFKEVDVGIVIMMGFMKRLQGEILEVFGLPENWEHAHETNLLNTHPGLLPLTAGMWGKHIQEFVLERRKTHPETQAGQTLHAVPAFSTEYDVGPTFAEHEVPVMPWDDPDTLFDAVQDTEKVWVPRDFQDYLNVKQELGLT